MSHATGLGGTRVGAVADEGTVEAGQSGIHAAQPASLPQDFILYERPCHPAEASVGLAEAPVMCHSSGHNDR